MIVCHTLTLSLPYIQTIFKVNKLFQMLNFCQIKWMKEQTVYIVTSDHTYTRPSVRS